VRAGCARDGWIGLAGQSCCGRDDPDTVDVVQTEGDEPARVYRGYALMKPPVVFDGAAIAQFAVAADDPGDAALYRRPTLSVNGLEFGCFGLAAGSEQHCVVLMQGQKPPGARCAVPLVQKQTKGWAP
jgi:hypothetical protein